MTTTIQYVVENEAGIQMNKQPIKRPDELAGFLYSLLRTRPAGAFTVIEQTVTVTRVVGRTFRTIAEAAALSIDPANAAQAVLRPTQQVDENQEPK
jgi:hypothetical protein